MRLDNNTRKEIEKILKQHRVKKAGIFGSYSREEAREDSDIDILVELPEDQDLLDLVGIKLDIEKSLNKSVDIVTYDSLNRKIKDHILKEQMILI